MDASSEDVTLFFPWIIYSRSLTGNKELEQLAKLSLKYCVIAISES